jgi:hypothetical protein
LEFVLHVLLELRERVAVYGIDHCHGLIYCS